VIFDIVKSVFKPVAEKESAFPDDIPPSKY